MSPQYACLRCLVTIPKPSKQGAGKNFVSDMNCKCLLSTHNIHGPVLSALLVLN